jgi:hypothetical protein
MLTQTRTNRKKYVDDSVNLKGNLIKIKNQARRLFRPISIHYVIKSPIQLVTVPLTHRLTFTGCMTTGATGAHIAKPHNHRTLGFYTCRSCQLYDFS